MIARLVLGATLVCVTSLANAESPPSVAAPAATTAPADKADTNTDAADEAEIQRAMAADQAAQTQKGSTTGSTTGVPAATPIAVSRSDTGAASTTGGRGFQSLNPDISAIIDLAGGWFSDDAGTTKSGDDPQSTGVKVQEVELALQQVVDPYFRADIFLTIPNLSGLEVEEAFLTTTQLPGNFQIKAGIFRAGLGRQNAQHLHLQDFPRRPALNAQLLGVDGLRSPGSRPTGSCRRYHFTWCCRHPRSRSKPRTSTSPCRRSAAGRAGTWPPSAPRAPSFRSPRRRRCTRG